jgi:glycosyltransferase involved in cell wall biosynthesis
VDLIHAHEFRANVFGAIVAKLCGIPLVGTVHGKNYYPDHVKRRMAYRWVSTAAKMVAVSEDLRRFLQDQVGVHRDRIARIYNGVDMPERISRERVAQFRSDLGIQPSEFTLGIVGSLYLVKGHTYLFDAFRSVLKLHPKTKLLVVGQGDLEDSLKRQVLELGIDHAVSFLGLRNDVPSILTALDLFVLPSLSEGLSVALLEAMSAAVPVVASSVGGTPEIVQDGQTGLLVSPKNAPELADRIIEIISNREKSKLLGERGRERVAKEFTTARMFDQYQKLYDGCLSGAP